ncbi:MAG: tandem-95 repeat protein [Sedimentisphaerales bacterium]|nr:tandem-95 repeat protein [Sedimentisphaerales bacterium]
MSKTFRIFLRKVFFSREKAAAINRFEEKLKAEYKARIAAEEKLRMELATRAAAEQKVNAQAEQKLMTQYRRYSVMAERVEAQAKQEIAKIRAELKDALRKLDSYKAEITEKEQKLNKVQDKLKSETAEKERVQNNLKFERQERKKVEDAAREKIEQVKNQAKEKIRTYTAELNQAKEKITEAEKQLAAEKSEPPAEEHPQIKAKDTLPVNKPLEQIKAGEITPAAKQAVAKFLTPQQQNPDLQPTIKFEPQPAAKHEDRPTIKPEEQPVVKFEDRLVAKLKALPAEKLENQPTEKANAFIRACRYLFNLHSRKRKVAFFSVLAILFAIAITFGVSMIKSTHVAVPDTITTQEDKPVQINLMAGHPDREHLTYNITTGPSHGSLSGRAPNMTYTPSSNYYGQDSFTYSIDEAREGKKQATISIAVSSVNDAPIAYHRTESIKVNRPLIAALTGTDADKDTLKFAVGSRPKHGTLTCDAAFETNGKFMYTPEPFFEGTDTFTFKLNDGKTDSALATVSIDVRPNRLPRAESYSVATSEDTPVDIVLKGNDPDLDKLSYTIVSETSHGSLKGAAPKLTYVPEKNFNGSDSFSFKVNDGMVDSEEATVSITISSVNDPPVANPDSIVTTEDTPATKIDVLANDTDIDNEGRYLYLDTLTVTAVTQGKNGSVAINTDGTLSYNPNADFFGNDEFTYTVSDNKGDSDTAKVIVTVTKSNDAPKIVSSPVVAIPIGTQYIYDVNAVDPDLTDTLTYSLITKPDDMTIDSETGLIQWRPTDLGENEIVVQVADSNNVPTTDTQSFIITVNPPPPKMAKLTPRDGYNHRDRRALSADGKAGLVRASDDERLVTSSGSYTTYSFSYISIPNDVQLKSVVVFIEHYEDERFPAGKLEWAAGTDWPNKPVVWATIQAPIQEGEPYETVDTWDITSIVENRERLNSLQLQVKNNDLISRKQTSIDYIYLIVEWE